MRPVRKRRRRRWTPPQAPAKCVGNVFERYGVRKSVVQGSMDTTVKTDQAQMISEIKTGQEGMKSDQEKVGAYQENRQTVWKPTMRGGEQR